MPPSSPIQFKVLCEDDEDIIQNVEEGWEEDISFSNASTSLADQSKPHFFGTSVKEKALR